MPPTEWTELLPGKRGGVDQVGKLQVILSEPWWVVLIEEFPRSECSLVGYSASLGELKRGDRARHGILGSSTAVILSEGSCPLAFSPHGHVRLGLSSPCPLLSVQMLNSMFSPWLGSSILCAVLGSLAPSSKSTLNTCGRQGRRGCFYGSKDPSCGEG